MNRIIRIMGQPTQGQKSCDSGKSCLLLVGSWKIGIGVHLGFICGGTWEMELGRGGFLGVKTGRQAGLGGSELINSGLEKGFVALELVNSNADQGFFVAFVAFSDRKKPAHAPN
ncbi:MAG: hypothetical protein QM813_25655 [Verrucomicrobiota bacterium]